MLKSFSVGGYRSFKEEAFIELRPITLLLGRNSSGKSSLTRFLPLLQQSINREASSPILWTSDTIDFGEIGDVINHDAKDGKMTIGLTVDGKGFYEYAISRSPFLYEVPESLSRIPEFGFVATLASENGRTVYKSIEITCEDDSIKIFLSGSMISRVELNGRHIEDYYPAAHTYVDVTSLFPSISLRVTRSVLGGTGQPQATFTAMQSYPGLQDAFEYFINKKVSAQKLGALRRDLMYAPKSTIGDYVSSQQNVVKSKKDHRYSLDRLSEALLVANFPRILEFFRISLQQTMEQASYMGPSRASGSRFYRYQELSIDRIDYRGDNLAMYLSSLAPHQMAKFNSLMQAACGYVLKINRIPGHASIEIAPTGSTQFENIADVGFGFSQFIPIIAQIHAATTNRIRATATRFSFPHTLVKYLAIEQPELHLHPALQGTLADLFSTAVRDEAGHLSALRFLIETHSEALVGRLGELVAMGALHSKDVVVYFVEKDDVSRNSRVSVGGFDSKGNLSGWPLGFLSSDSI